MDTRVPKGEPKGERRKKWMWKKSGGDSKNTWDIAMKK
jgi:hypothetical protein